MSKRYLWVVERKDGDEWVAAWDAATTRLLANKSKLIARQTFPQKRFRVVKYTPAE